MNFPENIPHAQFNVNESYSEAELLHQLEMFNEKHHNSTLLFNNDVQDNLLQVHQAMVQCSCIILVSLGLPANVLSMAVILRLKRTGGLANNTCTLLLMLLLSDVLVMGVHSFSIIRATLSGQHFFSIWPCRIFKYLWHAGFQWSAWCTVLVSVQHYWNIKFHPIKVGRAWILVIITTFAVFGYNLYLMPAIQFRVISLPGVHLSLCVASNRWLVWLLHLLLYAALPYVLVLLCNCAVLWHARYSQMTGCGERCLSYTLLGLTFTWIAFTLPYSIIFFVDEQPHQPGASVAEISRTALITRDVVRLLLLLHHSLLHILYLMCNSSFRGAMSHLICSIKCSSNVTLRTNRVSTRVSNIGEENAPLHENSSTTVPIVANKDAKSKEQGDVSGTLQPVATMV